MPTISSAVREIDEGGDVGRAFSRLVLKAASRGTRSSLRWSTGGANLRERYPQQGKVNQEGRKRRSLSLGMDVRKKKPSRSDGFGRKRSQKRPFAAEGKGSIEPFYFAEKRGKKKKTRMIKRSLYLRLREGKKEPRPFNLVNDSQTTGGEKGRGETRPTLLTSRWRRGEGRATRIRRCGVVEEEKVGKGKESDMSPLLDFFREATKRKGFGGAS